MKLILTLLFLTISIQAKELIYTMDDLKVLYSEKSHAEYIKHALDIRPIKRDEKWKSMTKEMSYGLLETLSAKKTFIQNDQNLLYLLDSIAFLKNDHVFGMKKGIFYASRLNHCQIQCDKLLTQYLRYRKYYKESDLEIYYKFKDHYKEADDLLTKVTTGKNASIYCKRDKVKYHFLNMIKSTHSTLGKYQSFISDECINAMKETLINTVVDSKEDKFSEFLTQVLIKSKSLKQEEEDFLLSLFVLGNPSKGKLFNLAWTRIENLSEDYKRRKKTLDKLLKLDPLPDSILDTHGQRKKLAVINHFNNFFPEYFSEYSKVCVMFLEGTGKYPLGNPTVNCDKYFSLSNKKKWISDSLKTRYSSAKKL